MKKIFFVIILYLSNIINIFASTSIEDNIIPDTPENTATSDQPEWKEFLFSIFEYIKDSIFWLLALTAISVFLFIWAKLVIARWNPEEFKKALMQFIYAIVWLAIVALSWAAVKLVSSLNF